MTQIPNYYDVLSLRNHPNLSLEEIKAAYKKASLLTHPDRHPGANESERRQAQEQFQKVADAFYVLSEKSRKKEYDRLLRSQQESNFNAHYTSSQDPLNDPIKFFKSFFFNGQDPDDTTNSSPQGQKDNMKPDPEATFAEVFNDLLQPEMDKANQAPSVWRYIGTASGGALGFITGNVPGLAFGALAGNRLGAVRDAKGKSVYEVFSDLAPDQKTKILKALAFKVLGYAMSKQ